MIVGENKQHQKRDWIVAFAIASCLIGISIGGLFKVLMGINSSTISVVIVIVSTFLLLPGFSFKNIRQEPAAVLVTLTYDILIVFLAFSSSIEWRASGVGFVYQIAYFLQVLLVVGLSWEFDSEKLIKVCFWMFGVTSIVTIYIIFSKGFQENLSVLLDRTENANSVSRATTAYIAFLSFCSTIVFKSHNKFQSFSRLLFVIVALTIMILSTRRSTFISIPIILVLLNRNRRVFRLDTFLKITTSIIILVSLFLFLYFENEFISSSIDRFWNSLTNGIETYLGIDSSDMAAEYRRERIETIPDQYLNHSTPMQFLFGRGYNADWLDIPFLQAFWDMGLFGGLVFMFVSGLIPLKHAFRISDDVGVRFFQALVTLRVIQNFSNGVPYAALFPFILLYTLERNLSQSQTETQSHLGDSTNEAFTS